MNEYLVDRYWISRLKEDKKWVYFGYRKNILWFSVSRKKYISYKNT